MLLFPVADIDICYWLFVRTLKIHKMCVKSIIITELCIISVKVCKQGVLIKKLHILFPT